MSKQKKSNLKIFIKLFSTILFSVYLLATCALYFLQEKMLFLNVKAIPNIIQKLNAKFPQAELFLKTSDDITLHGWHLSKPNTDVLNICFNGNGEEASSTVSFWHQYLKGSVITYNYRGYGKSTGASTQEKLFADALFIYDSIKAKYPQYKKIFLVGRSLGTGIACYLASKRDCEGLLLVSAYDSILNISRQNYPIFPVALCLKHPFDSQKLANKIKAPTFFIVAQRDSLILPSNSLNLYNQWQSKKELHYVPNADHNTIFYQDKFTRLLSDFYTFVEYQKP